MTRTTAGTGRLSRLLAGAAAGLLVTLLAPGDARALPQGCEGEGECGPGQIDYQVCGANYCGYRCYGARLVAA